MHGNSFMLKLCNIVCLETAACLILRTIAAKLSNNNLIQNTFGVKKAQPSKVESYLEVNT